MRFYLSPQRITLDVPQAGFSKPRQCGLLPVNFSGQCRETPLVQLSSLISAGELFRPMLAPVLSVNCKISGSS